MSWWLGIYGHQVTIGNMFFCAVGGARNCVMPVDVMILCHHSRKSWWRHVLCHATQSICDCIAAVAFACVNQFVSFKSCVPWLSWQYIKKIIGVFCHTTVVESTNVTIIVQLDNRLMACHIPTVRLLVGLIYILKV
jgi:hypothetical protein